MNGLKYGWTLTPPFITHCQNSDVRWAMLSLVFHILNKKNSQTNFHNKSLLLDASYIRDLTVVSELGLLSVEIHFYYIPCFNRVEVYWLHLIRPSFQLFVCPSVCGQNCVRSVSSTILAGFISYLHILSTNFRSGVNPR